MLKPSHRFFSLLGSLRARLRGGFARSPLVKNENGAAAVEFALVALPFLGLLFAVLESGIILFKQQTLATAVNAATRELRLVNTGTNSDRENRFRAKFCDSLGDTLPCALVKVDVRPFANLSNNSGNAKKHVTDNGFDSGLAGDVMFVRAAYEMPVYVSLFGSLANLEDGKRVISAASAYRNPQQGRGGN